MVVARTSGLTELVERGWAVGVEAEAAPQVVADALLAQLERPVGPDPSELPTWETCVDGLEEVYAETLPSPRARPVLDVREPA